MMAVFGFCFQHLTVADERDRLAIRFGPWPLVKKHKKLRQASNAMKVTVVEGNLLDQDVDVIVNAWNRNIIPWWLLLPQGVSGAIKKRGGTDPFKELRQANR